MSEISPTSIYREPIPESARGSYTAARFGVRFLWLESYVYDSAASLSVDYDGGFWEFYTLSNGGFYMTPRGDDRFQVACANGFEGALSADAFGITACLYAYSLLSFSAEPEFAEACVKQYHLLREYVQQHDEAGTILRAID